MPQKKQLKKTQKSKKLGIDPTLKPVVVETKGDPEQDTNPLNKSLPKGFKTADQVTEKDDLEFENGRLREMLVSWLDRVTIDGVAYQIMCDPLNRTIVIAREK